MTSPVCRDENDSALRSELRSTSDHVDTPVGVPSPPAELEAALIVMRIDAEGGNALCIESEVLSVHVLEEMWEEELACSVVRCPLPPAFSITFGGCSHDTHEELCREHKLLWAVDNGTTECNACFAPLYVVRIVPL